MIGLALVFFLLVPLVWCQQAQTNLLPLSRLVPEITQFSSLATYPFNTVAGSTFQGLTVAGNVALQSNFNQKLGFIERPPGRTDLTLLNQRYEDWLAMKVKLTTLLWDTRTLPSPEELESNPLWQNSVRLATAEAKAKVVTRYDRGHPLYTLVHNALDQLTLRTIPIKDILNELSSQDQTRYSVGIVGGFVRDSVEAWRRGETTVSANDVDVAISQPYENIVYQLRDIFVNRGVAIDDTVLDHSGIRKEFGLLKVPKISKSEEPLTESDGLDIGPMKVAEFPSVKRQYTNGGSFGGLGENTNHYLYGFSFAGDASFRDFTLNSLYLDISDPEAIYIIDPSGRGMDDSGESMLRFVDKKKWANDVGGWFRFFRFQGVDPSKNYKGDIEDFETTCYNLKGLIEKLIQNGAWSLDGSTIQWTAQGLLLKMAGKLKMSLEEGPYNFETVTQSFFDVLSSSSAESCPEIPGLLKKLISSPKASVFFTNLDGDSNSGRLSNAVIQFIRASPVSKRSASKRAIFDSVPYIIGQDVDPDLDPAIPSQYQCILSEAFPTETEKTFYSDAELQQMFDDEWVGYSTNPLSYDLLVHDRAEGIYPTYELLLLLSPRSSLRTLAQAQGEMLNTYARKAGHRFINEAGGPLSFALRTIHSDLGSLAVFGSNMKELRENIHLNDTSALNIWNNSVDIYVQTLDGEVHSAHSFVLRARLKTRLAGQLGSLASPYLKRWFLIDPWFNSSQNVRYFLDFIYGLSLPEEVARDRFLSAGVLRVDCGALGLLPSWGLIVTILVMISR